MKKSELKEIIKENMMNINFSNYKKDLDNKIDDKLIFLLIYFSTYYEKHDKSLSRLFKSSYMQLEKIKQNLPRYQKILYECDKCDVNTISNGITLTENMDARAAISEGLQHHIHTKKPLNE